MSSAVRARDSGVTAPEGWSLVDRLFAPVSAASVGLFRILFGALMAWHLSHFMPYVTQTLVNSKFFLTYDGFHWLHILPQPWMVALFWAMLAACALVAAGLFYRIAIVVLWLGWTYTLLLCQGHYNNHSYLFSLLSFLLIFTHANRWLSVDRAIGVKSAQPDVIPFWQLLLLRAQVFVVYFYAGIAKLGVDWLHGYPMKIWLAGKTHFPLIGGLLHTDAAAYLFSWGGLLFDLTMGFLLWSRRTRRWALVPLVAFHVTNSFFWRIGIFPWFMLAATSLFFEPDWPERLLARVGIQGETRGAARSARRARRDSAAAMDDRAAAQGGRTFAKSRLVVGFVCVYLVWQALFPLRHFLYSGATEWTGQGSFFAWRMLTVDRAEAVRVRVAIPGQGTVGYVQLDQYLNRTQFGKMNMAPWQYLRFAHFIRDEMRRNGGVENPEVYVDLKRRLNERPFQQVFDPEKNLAAVEYHDLGSADYILPLDPSLKPGTSPEWKEHLQRQLTAR